MVSAQDFQGGLTMGTGDTAADEFLARIARLERELASRDSYIEGLIARNRSLRVEVYTLQAEIIRLRRGVRAVVSAKATAAGTTHQGVDTPSPADESAALGRKHATRDAE